MQFTKFGLQKWVIAIYMITTSLKGTSTMGLDSGKQPRGS